MKTLKEIDAEIATLEKDFDVSLTKSQFTRLSNKIESLKSFRRYVESNPSETFVTSEKKRLTTLLENIESRYVRWTKEMAPKNTDPKKWRSIFNQETGFAKAKKQLKTINYILS